MWTVEVDGRRLWLRPNSSYIVGRSNSNNVDIPVEAASVSRQHLRLDIGPVVPGSSAHPSVRSSVTATDLGSRYGSSMDFDKLTKDTPAKVPARKDPVVFKIGPSAKFKLEWMPLTVTYSTGATNDEERKALWNYAVERLEPLEVKLVPDFFEQTTVYMKTGKGTSKLCYALAMALPVVNTQYIAALECMPRVSANPPDPAPYCPEPEVYAPNLERGHCLTGQTFQFVDPKQFDAVALVVKAAGGETVFDAAKLVGDAIVVASDTVEVKFAARVIAVEDVFKAIVECRKVDVSLAKEFTPRIVLVEATPRAETNDIIDSTRAERPEPRVAPLRRKRPRRDMLEFLTADEPTQPSSTESNKPVPEASPESNKSLPEAPESNKSVPEASESNKSLPEASEPREPPRKQLRTERQESPQEPTPLPPQPPASKAQGRKRTAAASSRPPKRTKYVEPEPEPTSEPEPEEELDLANIGELAIVDCDMEVRKPPLPTPEPASTKPNFKKFKRKQHRAYTHPDLLAPAEVRIDAVVPVTPDASILVSTPRVASEEIDEFSFNL